MSYEECGSLADPHGWRAALLLKARNNPRAASSDFFADIAAGKSETATVRTLAA
jgi:hypothetical protein